MTDAAQIQAAADQAGSLDILVNNADVALYDDLSDRAMLEWHLAVILFGTYDVTQAPMSASIAEAWRSGAADALERESVALAQAALAQAESIAS